MAVIHHGNTRSGTPRANSAAAAVGRSAAAGTQLGLGAMRANKTVTTKTAPVMRPNVTRSVGVRKATPINANRIERVPSVSTKKIK